MVSSRRPSAKKAKAAPKAEPKVAAKNVDHKKGQASVEKEVMVNAPDKEAEPAPPPAVVEERTLKVVDKGMTKLYTQSEYNKKFGGK